MVATMAEREPADFLERSARLAGVGAWQFDLASRRLAWAGPMWQLFDLPPDAPVPSLAQAESYFAAPARAVIRHAMLQAMEHGSPFDLELPFVTARGRSTWVRATGEAQCVDGRPMRVVGALQDVTRRRLAEQALHAQAEQLRLLYDQTPAALLSIDISGHVLSVTDAWLLRLGRSRAEVVGRPLADFMTSESSERLVALCLPALWRDRRIDRWAFQFLRQAPAPALSVLLSAIVEPDGNRPPRRALACIDDVSDVLSRHAELRREQEQRLEVERHARELDALLREREQMLDVLAHEVRQPLNNASAALQSAAALAQEKGDDAASRRLRRAQDVVGEVLAGVDNTLAVAAMLASPAQPAVADVDIDMLLAVAIADMPAAQRGRVHVERLAATRTATMDLALMRLALRNLLANALAHSAADRPVIVRVSDSDEPLALLIDVIDQGPGIDPAVLPRLFERGAHGPRPGGRASHGLGLYIVQRVMERHGGRARLLQTGPQGTTIRLELVQPA